MISFKGILKYLIYTFIAGWMFLLGIMVGRGTSPVKFDTQKFQKRLEAIVNEVGEKKGVQKKINLNFYDVLDHPVPEEDATPRHKPLEIIPKKETIQIPDKIPFKKSKKKQTFNPPGNTAKAAVEMAASVAPKGPKTSEIIKKKSRLGKTIDMDGIPDKKARKGIYTLQVAAFKDGKDAVTQMKRLEKKGFIAYQLKREKDGEIWYRIRIGAFDTYDEAKVLKEKLNRSKINSIILKRDSDEDING
ncbi:SPOR domain-containing protein [Desulfobacula sp.]|uniref:SPOR domain-containing protein n=1 Tax=Desulfobacula sp. TaxID=2593537 RepID=UPI002638D2A0|nr:SPOR domain-containing protein [Desulfobacula sp.]